MNERINSFRKNRFVLLVIFLVVFFVGNYFFSNSWLPTTDTKDLWFYSGIFMVLFSILFIEPYYTSPKNVITNTIPLLLVLLSIEHTFDDKLIWRLAFWSIFGLLFVSILALSLNDKEKGPNNLKNKISEILKKCVVYLGKGKILYSAVFIIFLLVNVTSKPIEEFIRVGNGYFLYLMMIWGIILSIDPNELHNTFSFKKKELDKNALGEIFGVQSKKIFLVRLFSVKDRKSIQRFDVVKFRYSMQDSNDFIITGIIFDTYLLNQEKWVKVLELKTMKKVVSLEDNIVYKISEKKELEETKKLLNVENFVGVVIQGSNIGKIKFEYSKKNNDLQEGDLLELKIDGTRLFYQVLNGVTVKENLEAKNETGFIEGVAMQLGEWTDERLSFQKFGWLPAINTPIFKADTSDIVLPKLVYPEYKLGVIPSTNLPSVIDLNDAVSHHIALLGVTGSGKSFIACEIIKQLQVNTKIICVDFTGEWRKKLSSLKPIDLIDKDRLPDVEEQIAKKEMESSGRYPDKTKILGYKRAIQLKLDGYIASFMESESKIAMFEIPELSNTMFIMEFTQMFLEGVFNYAKRVPGKKICIVLEEAHTVIPETNFLGDLGDYGSSKALVSKMSQIALQGRKYGVGLLVIAQRTANVSKTVLTQCNTVICFQAFDETSFSFLGNYIGKDMVQTLPNLKQYHAIVTGKAIKSNIPMIVNLYKKED